MTNFLPQIPDILYRKMCQVHGPSGKYWLGSLPTLLSDIFDLHQLSFVREMENLSYNWVMVVKDSSKSYVLKLGPPHQELCSEIAALSAFEQNTVELIDSNAAKGYLLLEYLQPGTLLKSEHDDQKATHIAAKLMQHLHVKADNNALIPVENWLSGFDKFLTHQKLDDSMDIGLLINARDLAKQLLDSSKDIFLLHGDLHHENIIADGQGWKVIDPKGVLGEKCYEVGAYLRNPYPSIVSQQDIKTLTEHRLTIFQQKLGFERARMLDWAFVQAMLSAVWFMDEQDKIGFKHMQQLARVFFDMRQSANAG